jgi:hypothetical protein
MVHHFLHGSHRDISNKRRYFNLFGHPDLHLVFCLPGGLFDNDVAGGADRGELRGVNALIDRRRRTPASP